MAEAPPTFSESWHRVAGLRVCLRAGVRIERQRYRGERWIVLRNPFNTQYFRLRPAAYEFVARLRPERTVEEVWAECVSRFPDEAPGQEAVLQLLSQLYFANLLHYERAADSAMLFERFKKRRQREMSARLLNLMFMRFPLLDPDWFLVRTLPVAGRLISRAGAVVWLVVVGLGLKVVIDNFPALRAQGQGILDSANLPLLYLALVLIKTMHEFGHAYFCRKFGGEVHVMGVMLMIFTPVPYVDASSSWSFRRHWQRALVGAGGMIVELFVAACAAFVWAATGPGTIHSVAYNAMFIASVSTVIFNANPLLRFDGYYILSDLLEIPNLAQRSSRQLRHLWEHYVFGVRDSEGAARTGTETAWLVFYGIASGLYRVIVFAGVLLMVADRFLILGIIMALVCLVSWVTAPVVNFIRYLAAGPQLRRVRARAVAITAGLAAAALVLLAVVPFPRHFRAPGVAQARQRTEVVNDVAGVVEQILAESGARVSRGQPLMRLSNRKLELELAGARARYAEAQARLLRALTQTNADLQPLASRLDSVSNQLAKLTADQAALTIVARHDGIWVAPRIKDSIGRRIERGMSQGLLIDPAAFEFVATVQQADADSALASQPRNGEVRLRGQAGVVLKVSRWIVTPGGQELLPSPALGQAAGGDIPVSRKDPGKATEPFFEIRADLAPCADAALLHGRRGAIRFELKPEPLLPRWLRSAAPAFAEALQIMNTPSEAYRRVSFRAPAPLLQGLDEKVEAVAGLCRRRSRIAAGLRREADRIDAQAGEWRALDDFSLHESLLELRARFRRGGRGLDSLLAKSLAAIREAADRKLGLRPFPVQLMGALALHRGWLAEMATGEGKTLTAGLAAILAGWNRRPCHIVTVNDYLVERDAQWMRPLHAFCGVRTGCVTAAMMPLERRQGYEADVTYVTSKELLADFLRDRLQLRTMATPARRLIRDMLRPRGGPGADGLVMRGLDTALVDEADSVLIDEAVTPLIISAPQKNELLESAVLIAQQVAGLLEPERDYRVNPRYREIEINPAGREKLEAACRELPGLWRGAERRNELVRQALSAREFFLRDKQYIVAGEKIVIVDEFTGRQMVQRTWRQGLHQAVEAKEGLPISDPAETIARLSFQRFFRCFRRLAGMTGTAREAAAELWHIYKLPVIAIPTNRPCVRQRWPDAIFANEAAKLSAVVVEARRLHATGRPLLVGTRSVQASEKLAALLGEAKLDCKILNAARHGEEAAIVALAGERGRITIATNMAGRGTDIKLGWGVAGLGGLHVLATERHESGRVDRQLFGRAARQGDPGSGQAFVSVTDELVQRYLPSKLAALLARGAGGSWLGWPTMAQAAFAAAQSRSQKQAYHQRQAVLQADTWLDEGLSFAGSNVV